MIEIQALQNFANDLELFVHEKFEQDKRKTTKKYFLTQNGTSVSPVLDYNNMNSFLMGWLNCTKHGTNAASPDLLEALQTLLKSHRQLTFSQNHNLNDSPVEVQAQTAINKATGNNQ